MPSRREPAREPTVQIFPHQLHVGDRSRTLTASGRSRRGPAIFKQEHDVRARVQRPGDPGTVREVKWTMSLAVVDPHFLTTQSRRVLLSLAAPLSVPQDEPVSAVDDARQQSDPNDSSVDCGSDHVDGVGGVCEETSKIVETWKHGRLPFRGRPPCPRALQPLLR